MPSPIKDAMQRKLTEALKPALLDIKDNSAKHAGHSGSRPAGETHFAVKIVSDRFDGLTRVQRHQLAYKILAFEMKTDIHALELDLKTIKEHS